MPLRERREDIPALLRHFVDHYARQYGKSARMVPPDVMTAIAASDWPGNVRVLRHAAERAVILAEGNDLFVGDVSLHRSVSVNASSSAAVSAAEDLNLDRAERMLVEQALRKHAFNISNAAAELGPTRATLHRRMLSFARQIALLHGGRIGVVPSKECASIEIVI